MPRKAKTEETVVTEENILHENDMETENVPDMEETEMDGESPDTLSADADTDFPAAEESTETAVPAKPASADEVKLVNDIRQKTAFRSEHAIGHVSTKLSVRFGKVSGDFI